MRKILTLCAAAAAVSLAAPATAATFVTDAATGKITGATGIDVNGTLYNVTFVNGSCTQVFGTCDPSKFDFAQGLAGVGSTALAALWRSTMNFSDFSKILGCGDSSYCLVMTPYSHNGSQYIAQGTYFDRSNALNGGMFAVGYDDQDSMNNTTIARWSLASVSAVPEPSTWAMMLVGFGGVGFAMRRAKKTEAKLAIA